jgi:hypothetical protein
VPYLRLTAKERDANVPTQKKRQEPANAPG